MCSLNLSIEGSELSFDFFKRLKKSFDGVCNYLTKLTGRVPIIEIIFSISESTSGGLFE